MAAYENDILVIPEKYKKMSVSELEREEKKVLGKLLSSDRPKKIVRKNKNDIRFKF
jgi:hypothetical protein